MLSVGVRWMGDDREDSGVDFGLRDGKGKWN